MPNFNATSSFTSFVTSGREVISCRSGSIQLETGVSVPNSNDGTILDFPNGAIVIEDGITVHIKRSGRSSKAEYNRTVVG